MTWPGQARDRLFVRAPVSRRVRSRRVARELRHDRPRRRRHPKRARPSRRPGGSGRGLLGVHTLRAVENFPISGQTVVDRAGSGRRARRDQAGGGAREPRPRPARRRRGPRAIVAACEEIRAGALHDQFVVDLIQGGAGTSTNMNANEVIANRALELLGASRAAPTTGCTRTSMSTWASRTNDVVSDGAEDRRLVRASTGWSRPWRGCAAPSQAKADRVRRRAQDGPHPAPGRGADDARPGVRHLCPDARRGRERASREAAGLICEINMGATAIGTGITAPPRVRRAGLRASARHHRHRRSSPRRIWSRRPRTAAPSSSSRAC